ncbi:FAS1-like dehydratase domain-containing protein [Streptomyces sp. JNUCC 64]
MALDQSFAGRSYPPTPPYEVGREKIREFARAVGDPHPAYRDPGAARALGHPDVIAPPTFVFALTYAAAGQAIRDPGLGLDFDRVVHGGQRFAHTRPVRAGDRLSVTTTIESLGSLGGNDVVEIRGDVHDEDGDHVTTDWIRLVARATGEE